MITAFVPCRAGSRRVPGKNTRPFAEHEYGLLGIKLEQLSQIDSIDQIVVSSNDQQVLSIASDLSGSISKPVRVIERPDSLSVDDCLDDLIRYVGDLIDDGHVRKFNDRVGNKPAMVVTPQMRGYDIDTPEQFEFAEVLMTSGVLTSRRSDYEQCGGD